VVVKATAETEDQVGADEAECLAGGGRCGAGNVEHQDRDSGRDNVSDVLGRQSMVDEIARGEWNADSDGDAPARSRT